ncbi:hypothetical protein CBR_g38669 [Chara braunii]|uniref:Uncharacterized protein n=1 Tax=Chara braunii TaxID=69332 RepID=A0A388K0W6_CHABU|nr:hypothetical protein CBR_g38669 [Chara braunii]|eukprot:GBG63603.1 hypothetical protein CBR_g38669 [Chara braunii]
MIDEQGGHGNGAGSTGGTVLSFHDHCSFQEADSVIMGISDAADSSGNHVQQEQHYPSRRPDRAQVSGEEEMVSTGAEMATSDRGLQLRERESSHNVMLDSTVGSSSGRVSGGLARMGTGLLLGDSRRETGERRWDLPHESQSEGERDRHRAAATGGAGAAGGGTGLGQRRESRPVVPLRHTQRSSYGDGEYDDDEFNSGGGSRPMGRRYSLHSHRVFGDHGGRFSKNGLGTTHRDWSKSSHPSAEASETESIASRSAAAAAPGAKRRPFSRGSSRGPGPGPLRKSPAATLRSDQDREAGDDRDMAIPSRRSSAGHRASRGFHRDGTSSDELHSEIDKLLGGLKTELDGWREGFDDVCSFWVEKMRLEYPDTEEDDWVMQSMEELRLSLERYVDDVETERKGMQQKCQALSCEKAEMMRMVDDAVAEVEGLRAAEREARDKTKMETESAMNELRAQIKLLSSELEERGKQLHEFRNTSTMQSKHISALQVSSIERDEKIVNQRRRIDELEIIYMDAKRELERKEEKLSANSSLIQALQQQLEEMKEERRMAEEEIHRKNEELQRADDRINQTTHQHLREVSALKASIAEVEEALQRKDQRLVHVEKVVADTEKELAAAKAEQKEVKNESILLQQELSSKTEEARYLRSEVNRIIEEMGALKTDFDYWKGEAESYRSEVEALKAKNSEASAQVLKMETEMESVMKSLEKAEEEKREVDEEIRNLREKMERDEAAWVQAKDAMEEKHKKTLRAWELQQIELEARTREKYETLMLEQEEHLQRLEAERVRAAAAEAERVRKLEADRKRREEMVQQQLVGELHEEFRQEKEALQTEAREAVMAKEKELLAQAKQHIDTLKEEHRKEIEELRMEAAKEAAAMKAAQRKFEEEVQAHAQRVVREHVKVIEEDMHARQERYNRDREAASEKLLERERAAHTAAMEAQENERHLRDELARLQSVCKMNDDELAMALRSSKQSQETADFYRKKLDQAEIELKKVKEEWARTVNAHNDAMQKLRVERRSELEDKADQLQAAIEEMSTKLVRKARDVIMVEDGEFTFQNEAAEYYTEEEAHIPGDSHSM